MKLLSSSKGKSAFRILGVAGLILILGTLIAFLLDGHTERTEYDQQHALYEEEKPMWQKMDALRKKSDTDPASHQALIELMPPEDIFREMIKRRAQFEADEIAINNLVALHAEPTLLVRTLELIDAPFRKLSFGLFTVDKRDYRVIESEQRQYPKSTVQDLLEGALTLGVIGGLIWLGVIAKRKWL